MLLQGMATRSTARRTRKLRAWKPPLVLRNNARGRSSNMTVASTACCAFPCSVHSVPRCNAPRHVLLPRASAITHTHTEAHTRAHGFLVVLPNRASPSLPSPSQRSQRSQRIHPSVRPSVCPSWAVNPARRTLLRARCARLLTRSLPPSSLPGVTRLPERPTASSSTSPGGARREWRQASHVREKTSGRLP